MAYPFCLFGGHGAGGISTNPSYAWLVLLLRNAKRLSQTGTLVREGRVGTGAELETAALGEHSPWLVIRNT